MEDFFVILLSLVAIAVLVLIGVYNSLDRLRFRLDRMLKSARPALNDWAEECERLQPGVAAAYRAARPNWKKIACLKEMVDACSANSEEKLEIQEQLLDFCYRYSELAEKYNQKVTAPLTGWLARFLGFRPYAPLDFYPDVTVPKPEKPEA